MGVATREHRRCHMAGTRSSVDKSQSPSIDARADCGGWTMSMVRLSSSFLKTMGPQRSEPELFAGVGWGRGLGDRGMLSVPTCGWCVLLCVPSSTYVIKMYEDRVVAGRPSLG